MPEQDIKGVVQRMIDAGESEENIATVIQSAKAKAPPKTPRDEALDQFTPQQRQSLTAPFAPGGNATRSLGQLKKNVTANAPALAAMALTEGAVNPTTMGMLTKVAPKAGPVIAGSRWLKPIVGGVGATGGALARGDQPGDAVEEGINTALWSRYLPTAVEKVMNIPSAIGAKGLEMARGYLKPTLAAGRQEAMREFGKPSMASTANEAVVKRALERNILGADNPEMAVSDAIDAAEGKLGKLVGNQPTRLNDLMKVVEQRGVKAAQKSAYDIPGALNTVDTQMERMRSGALGPKVDFGQSIPPGPTGNVSAKPLLEAMRGKQPTPGVPAPQAPKLLTALQRIEAQPAGGNITTGRPIVTQEVQGPALATSRLEAPMSGQTPRRFAGGGSTQVMREAPAGSPTGDLIGRNYSGEVKEPGRQLIASHRPQNVTAKEALDFARGSARQSNWDKPSSSLLDWFTKQQESAARTAVKEAVPESRPLLNEVGELLSLRRIMSQAMNREGNKNAFMRLPAMLGALKTSNPALAAGTLAGGAALDKSTGKIAQGFYNFGKNRQPTPEMIQNMKNSTLGLALMQLLKQRDADTGQ